MKLNIDLAPLWAAVNKMGDVKITDFTIEIQHEEVLQIDTDLSGTKGIEIVIDDIDPSNGVLSYQGRQVVLFIPDQGPKIDEALADPMQGRRYHVAECKTLNEMRRKNRFGRYNATNNLEGLFHIFGVSQLSGQSREGDAALKVCMNCLDFLNYRGYKTDKTNKKRIHAAFDIPTFLTHYSTLFKSMPPSNYGVKKGGYADDWDDISAKYRQSVNYTCEQCQVDLKTHKNLLHTHHINGNKRDNEKHNLKALCIDCHRKQPMHDYMRLKHSDMLLISALRREQNLFIDNDWEDAIAIADTSIQGVLLSYKANGYAAPVIGYEVSDKSSAVIAQIEAAWPENKFGIIIDSELKNSLDQAGWQVLTTGEALLSINQ